jgi:integrase
MTTDLVLARRYTRDNAYEVFDYLDISEATRMDYRARLTPFISFIEKSNQFNVNTFLEYKRELRKRDDLSVSSRNKQLTAARIFLKELHRRGILPTDTTVNVRNFRQGKYHKKDGLTQQEVESVRDWCYLHHADFRNVAIASLLLYHGLRQVEIVRLNWEDINLKNKVLWIRGKGKDDKEPVFIHDDVALALRRLLYTVQDKRGYLYGNTERIRGAVFRSKTYSGQYKRLTTRGVRLVIEKMFIELGIKGKSTHSFRHYFVTKLLRAYGGDIMTVMKYTRHRSPQMLEVYNDRIIQERDLPKFFRTFDDLKLVV